jgi:hypothetical protein
MRMQKDRKYYLLNDKVLRERLINKLEKELNNPEQSLKKILTSEVEKMRKELDVPIKS